MPCEKCVVCNIKFENDIPNVNHGNPNEGKVNEKLSFIYRKILRIFCSYFNLPQNETENDNGNQDDAENTNENGILFSFPFCSECRNLVAELCIFHEKFEAIQKLVQKTVAKITMKILNTENEQENSSTLNSSSQKENEKQNENGLKYRRKIIQDFSPRVLLTKYLKPNSEPKQMQRNETNELSLTTNSIEENFSDDEDCHGNESENDDQNKTDKIKETVNEPNQNDNENSASSPAPEKRSQNLMEKIRSIAKPGQKVLLNSPSTTALIKIPTQLQPISTGFTTIGNKYIHSSGKWWAENTDFGWKCSSCSRFFSSNLGARHHMENEHVTGKFKCTACPRSFIRESLLKIHRCDFQKRKKSCKPAVEISRGKFKFKGKWEFVQKEGGKLQCSTCSAILQRRSSLLRHIRRNHESTNQILMPNPNSTSNLPARNPKSNLPAQNSNPNVQNSARHFNSSTFAVPVEKGAAPSSFLRPLPVTSSQTKVEETRLVHRNGNYSWSIEKTKFGWKCGFCPIIYKNPNDTEHHMKMWHIPGKFKCDSCPRSFILEDYFRAHRCGLEDVDQSEEIAPGKFELAKWKFERRAAGGFQCSSCSLILVQRRQMSEHIKQNHISLQCDICQQFLTTKEQLERHLASHSELEPEPESASSSFTSSPSLSPNRPRLPAFGGEVKNGTVEVSPGKFMYEGKWGFVQNFKGIFQCSLCSAARRTKPAMAEHMKYVHDSVHFQCEMCGQYFQTKQMCDSHVASHGHLHPHSASSSSSFSSSSGAEDFKCEAIGCHASFISKPLLQLHYKNRHYALNLKLN